MSVSNQELGGFCASASALVEGDSLYSFQNSVDTETIPQSPLDARCDPMCRMVNSSANAMLLNVLPVIYEEWHPSLGAPLDIKRRTTLQRSGRIESYWTSKSTHYYHLLFLLLEKIRGPVKCASLVTASRCPGWTKLE